MVFNEITPTATTLQVLSRNVIRRPGLNRVQSFFLKRAQTSLDFNDFENQGPISSSTNYDSPTKPFERYSTECAERALKFLKSLRSKLSRAMVCRRCAGGIDAQTYAEQEQERSGAKRPSGLCQRQARLCLQRCSLPLSRAFTFHRACMREA